jgi:hypothetical protein
MHLQTITDFHTLQSAERAVTDDVGRMETIVYSSDAQLAARSLIYSGPRQVTGLVRLVKVSISA